MNRFSFYDSHKTYEPETVSWPKENDIPELSQMGDGNIGFIVDVGTRFDVVNPVFYMCRAKGVVRLNRTTYVEVGIPERLISKVRLCPNIEVTLSYPESSFESFRATVKHLLRFPDFLAHKMSPASTPDIDLDELERPLQADKKQKRTASFSDDDEDMPLFRQHEENNGNADDRDAFSLWPRTSPRSIFKEWIADHGGEIVFESAGGYLLAHDGRNLLIVSFFDEKDIFWLTDEDKFDGEPPLWFSENGPAASPLYKLGLAAEHFNRLSFCHVLPLTVLSDHIELINAEDMAKKWDQLGMHVCYCHRTEKYADTFEHFLESAAKTSGEFRIPCAENMNALKNEVIRYEKENK